MVLNTHCFKWLSTALLNVYAQVQQWHHCKNVFLLATGLYAPLGDVAYKHTCYYHPKPLLFAVGVFQAFEFWIC